MKISLNQLDAHLQKTLAPLYLISGDETLLVQEAADKIRKKALASGYTERTSLTPDPGSDWGKAVYAESHSLSLFASSRIVEIHLSGMKFNAASTKLLQEIASNPPPDTLLIITLHKLDSKTEQTVWYKTLDKHGVTLPIWPIPREQLTAWIQQRAKRAGVNITTGAAETLANYTEGNLLATAQEIEKLGLIPTEGQINADLINTLVSDNAQYDIFNLVDCALKGDLKRTLHILQHLQAEGVEPILILWALTREIRTLTGMKQAMQQGANINTLWARYRIFEKRQAGCKLSLQKLRLQDYHQLLLRAATLDRLIKGVAVGDIWLSLRDLALGLSATTLLQDRTHELIGMPS